MLTDPAQGGRFVHALSVIPAEQRYSYNFGGVSELIDAILLSPALAEEATYATIIHTNTDFPSGWRLDTSPERLPYRASDHDAAVVVLGRAPATPTPQPTPAAPSPTTMPTATPLPATLAATATATPMPILPTGTPAAAAPTTPALGNGRAWVLGVAAVALVVAGGLLARRLAHR